ncbi:hypothetical protein BH11ARM2_BH11ARM2_29340 [soil metagenome]
MVLLVAPFALLLASDPVGDAYRTLVDRGTTPGLAWARIRDGRIVRHGEYGYADLENRVKVRRDTRFEIGSMTKQFTAAVAILMVKEGKFSLDDPVGKHLTGLPEAWQPFTIRRLLSHTSGLKDYLGTFSVMETRYVPPKEIVDKMGKATLDFEPGTAWAYSNTGYLVISMLLEKIDGKPLAQIYQERLFKPLGMTSTGSSAPDEVMPNRAHGYLRTAKGWQNMPTISPSLASGAGLLVSTLDDMAKWQSALQTGRIPTDDLWKPVEMKNGSLWNYGLGWMIEPIDGKTIVHHGGNTAGQSSDILITPDRKEALVVFSNANGLNPGGTSRYVAGLLDPTVSLEDRRQSDPNPRQTLDLAVTLREWSRGRRRMDMFASEFQSVLNTLRGISYRQALAVLGKSMKRMDYVDEETFGGDRWVNYRFDMGPAKVFLAFRWNPDGKIVQLDQVYAR